MRCQLMHLKVLYYIHSSVNTSIQYDHIMYTLALLIAYYSKVNQYSDRNTCIWIFTGIISGLKNTSGYEKIWELFWKFSSWSL